MGEWTEALKLLTDFFEIKLIALCAAQALAIGFFLVATELVFVFLFAPPGSYFHATRASARYIRDNERLETAAALADGRIAVLKQMIDDILRPKTSGFAMSTAAGTGLPSIASGLPPLIQKPPSTI